MFGDKSFQIAVAKKDLILTSDNPIILRGTNEYNMPKEIVFPLTSRIVLHMKSIELTESDRINRLVVMADEFVTRINQETVMHARKWVYSKSKMTEFQFNKWLLKE